MPLYGSRITLSTQSSIICSSLEKQTQTQLIPIIITKPPLLCCINRASQRLASVVLVAATTTALVLSASAIEVAAPTQPEETLSNIPQMFSSVCEPEQKDCKRRYKIQKPKSRKAETCTSKCVGTCIQGGFGSPGEGPFNIRRPLVVFKDGFRSRKYCLSECSDICNLIGDGDDGP